MDDSQLLIAVYLLPLLAVWGIWALVRYRRTHRAREILEDNVQAGLGEPSSLHPCIDLNLCLGCGACVRACPEKKILDLIDGKAVLIEPTMCVGHGACQTACPTHAIKLVFGTEERGVEIPMVTPQFESSVPGIYIAGELGGMGLVKNAIEQGRQAMDSIAKRARAIPDAPDVLDTVVVGCGPAGISASLGAIEHKLKFVTIDQSDIGGTVAHFPRGKMVMTAPAVLPIVGQVKFGEVRKEELVSFWLDVVDKAGLEIRSGEQVLGIAKEGDHFVATTSGGAYRTKTVLLAIGRRGTPRTLDVPGEELEKVVYRLVDAEQYAGANVLVVGGGDSALEAASQLAEQPGTRVTLSYRSAAYSRARKKNRAIFSDHVDAGRIEELLESNVLRITPDSVEIRQHGAVLTRANDYVIVCAGGVLPSKFLEDIGISVETKFGTA